MPDTFTPINQVEWRDITYLDEYLLRLPRPLADWDVYGDWERERVHHMRDHLHNGDTLFDVGAEHGWLSLVYATMVGPENMVLIEPTPLFWPNIRETWNHNYSVAPKACYDGLASDKTTDNRHEFDDWPASAWGDLIDVNSYRCIHENASGAIPEMRLDDLVTRSGIVPDALTIDVEGAELLVLQGAHYTLKHHRPQIWCSVHPDLMARDYHHTPAQLLKYLSDHGYGAQHIATDHEMHYYFQPLS